MDHEQLKISSVANLTSDSMGMPLGKGGGGGVEGALKVLEKSLLGGQNFSFWWWVLHCWGGG